MSNTKKPLSQKAFVFETKNEPLLPHNLFIRRSINHLFLGIGIIFLSLLIGIK